MEKNISDAYSNMGYLFQHTSDGVYIFTAETSTDYHQFNIWLVKIDSLGNKIWDNTSNVEEWEYNIPKYSKLFTKHK